jgi:CRP-like cAMP-binding protein
MAIDDDIAFLERVPTIGLLGRPALRILAIGAETRHLRDGEMLFNAGDQADGGYVIQAGRLSLRSSEDAKERTVGPYTLLGEVALFAETKRTATATTLEPAIVLFIPRPLFIRMLDSFPEAAAKLREILASRVDQTTRQIANVGAFLDAHEPN